VRNSDPRMQPLRSRLRRPASASSVTGSLPILFFGDLFRACVASVGLNPSDREYQDRAAAELQGRLRRFETLTSLGAAHREELTDQQSDRAIGAMTSYFDAGRPSYTTWFGHLANVFEGMGYSYRDRSATHLDLVQEATFPTWSALEQRAPAEASALLRSDRDFLAWQLVSFDLEGVLSNGAGVSRRLRDLLEARELVHGKIARITWRVSAARIGQRSLWVAEWNLPLVRATGLGKVGELELGRTLRAALSSSGLIPSSSQ
jgi:hypothetical protein